MNQVQLKKESIIFALKRVSGCSKVTQLEKNELADIFKGKCWYFDKNKWILKGQFYVTFSEVKYFQQA